jgi:hypothetical protein
MKEAEKNKLRQLDPEGLSGTIQSVLLDPNINQAHYADVLYYLLNKTLEERGYYERVCGKMQNVLKGKSMLKELNECLELEEKK